MEYIIIGHLTLLTLSIHSYLHNCHLNVNHKTDNKLVDILIYMRINVYFLSFLDILTCIQFSFCQSFQIFRRKFFLPRNTITFAITKTHKMGQAQSKYPVLHQGTFGGTGFLFLGRLGSRANTEKKGSGPIMNNFLGWFFHVFRGKK